MNDNIYRQITPELYKKHIEGGPRYAYIAQRDFPKSFKRVVEGIAKRNSELFVSEAFIVTERLSPLAEAEVVRIAKRNGYRAKCTQENARLRYLGSDFGGHYSSDYYEILEYSLIRITSH